MIKFSHKNDFSAVKFGSQSKKILFSILGTKEQKNSTRIPLNISLGIDVSGSMDDIVHPKQNNEIMEHIDKYPSPYQLNQNPALDLLNNLKPQPLQPYNGLNIFGHRSIRPKGPTKLDQVIKAAKACVDLLEVGDFISIVTFNSSSRVVLESTQITLNNKPMIQNVLDTITAGGGTNLYDGWVTSGIEVAKKNNTNYINRILLLTDGQTNVGVVDTATIVNSVKELSMRGITTTTFGFGNEYNEDLLEKMATISGGNAHYIEDNSQALMTFINEFKALNSLVTDNATLEFVPTQPTHSITCVNELDYVNKKFIVGNLIHNKEMTYLFECHFDNTKKSGESFNLGKMILTYTDSQGVKQNQVLDLDYLTVSEEAFAAQVVDKDIEVKNAILSMAKTQKQAKEEMNRGNSDQAYALLRGSISAASAYSFDANVTAEIAQVNSLLQAKDSYSPAGFSKSLSSMSYATRNNRK